MKLKPGESKPASVFDSPCRPDQRAVRSGGEHAVLKPPGQWNAVEKKAAARIEQEHFVLAVLQHADRACVYP